jgi:hypothetical protein
MRSTTAHSTNTARLIAAGILALVAALAVALASAAAQAPGAKLHVVQNGPGTVTVEGPRLLTPQTCDEGFYPNTPCEYDAFLQGETVKLTARPTATDAAFQGWSDDRCPAVPVCLLTLADAQTVVALFSPLAVLVSVDSFGDGTETVTITDAGGRTCAAVQPAVPQPTACSFALGATLTLVATGPQPKWNAQDCDAVTAGGARSSTCTTTLLAQQQAHVAFGGPEPNGDAPPRTDVTFRARKTGDGSGTIRGALDCGSSCTVRTKFGQRVTIVATPDAGSRFVRWSGACGTDATCTLQATATSVAAEFAALPQAPAPHVGRSSTPFRAVVGRIAATGHGRTRKINVPVTVNAPAAVLVRLSRHGRGVVTRRFPVTPGATRVLRLRVPGRSRAGGYRLSVAVRDRAGSAAVRVTRSVRLPR